MVEKYIGNLPDDATILDFGSGRRPAIPREQRPARGTYIGLDVSADELELAGSDAYDERWVSVIENQIPALLNRVDFAISWQVLEHVDDLGAALSNVHAYLKPGGSLLSMVSGRNACYAIFNRVIPERIGKAAMERLLHRPSDTVFHANYDDCTYDDLMKHFNDWSFGEVIPFYRAAGYFNFSRLAQRAYLAYEDRILRSNRKNLATHYLIHAVK